MLVEILVIMIIISALLLLFGADPLHITTFWVNIAALVIAGIFIGMGIDVYTMMK